MKNGQFLKKTIAFLLVLCMALPMAALADNTVWENANSKFYPDYGTQAEMRQAAS